MSYIEDAHGTERVIYFQVSLFSYCNIDFYNRFFLGSTLGSLLFLGILIVRIVPVYLYIIRWKQAIISIIIRIICYG